MKTIKFVASLFVIGTLLTPVAGFSGTYVKDSIITSKVKSKLAAEKDLTSRHISVDTDANGMVVLGGTVESEAEKQKAAEIAKSTEGVTKVQNEIQIKKGPATGAGTYVKDSVITTKIKSKLAADDYVKSRNISVDTDANGVVVLHGTVESEAEKTKAHEIAHSVDGVTKVINEITIKKAK